MPARVESFFILRVVILEASRAMQHFHVYISADPMEFEVQRQLILSELSSREWISSVLISFTPNDSQRELGTPQLVRLRQCDLLVVLVGEELRSRVVRELEEGIRFQRTIIAFVESAQTGSIHVLGIANRRDIACRSWADSSDLAAQIAEEIRVRMLTKLRADHSAVEAITVQPNLDKFHKPNLHGRKTDIENLLGRLNQEKAGYTVVVGRPGIGKTALLASLAGHIQAQDGHCVRISVVDQYEGRPVAVLGNLLKQMTPVLNRDLSRDTGNVDVLCSLLEEGLYMASHLGRRLVVIIDAVDQGTDTTTGRRLVHHLPASLPNGIHFVLSTKEPTLDTKPDWHKYGLKSLDEDAAKLVLGDLELPKFILDRIIVASDGLPVYLDLLVKEVKSGLLTVEQLTEQVPKSFKDYLGHLWKRVPREDRALMARIAASRRPVSAQDLSVSLDSSFSDVTEQLTRMEPFLRFDDDDGYTLFHAAVRDFVVDQIGETEMCSIHLRLGDVLGLAHPDFAYHLYKAHQFEDLMDFAARAFAELPGSFDGLQNMREAVT